jgi:Spy/CpxP family protein refolding chaperone
LVNTWKVILATIVIFSTGVLTGGLLVRHTEKLQAPPPRQDPPHTRPAMAVSAGSLRLEFLRRAQRELDLTAEQRERIDKILKDSQERTHQIMQPVAPELHAELDRTKEQFLGVLTPAQRIRFEQLVKRQQRPRDSRHTRPQHETSSPPATLQH